MIVQATDQRRSEGGSQADGGDHGTGQRQAPPGGGDDQKQAELIHGGREAPQIGADKEARPGGLQKSASG